MENRSAVGLEQRAREPVGSRNPRCKFDARSYVVSEWIRRVGVEVLRSERTEESSTKTRCSELLQGDVYRIREQ